MSGGRKPAVSGGGDEAEVEALLRAAQDAVLLKLQANSHLVSSSSSSPAAAAPNPPPSLDPSAADADPLDADLARRFEALRSRPPGDPKRPDAPAAGAGAGGMDELEARLAALKGAAGRPEKGDTRVRLEDLDGESEEEDEVDKVMRWAMDAARLDVATAGADRAPSATAAEGEQEEDDKSSSVSSGGDEEERMELERKRKETMSKNKPKSKWFFF
ncbi:uncharacterized protein LOC121055173 [Oryza brachyantha]|uniref:uncharacterized protein LOC121055173 n=1 Tax=Oryza brachyantha TaxID=4533 RepID=UPI001ADA6027|nr:uncharacterized protein LOC121055173 [Oryza brachyantha]